MTEKKFSWWPSDAPDVASSELPLDLQLAIQNVKAAGAWAVKTVTALPQGSLSPGAKAEMLAGLNEAARKLHEDIGKAVRGTIVAPGEAQLAVEPEPPQIGEQAS